MFPVYHSGILQFTEAGAYTKMLPVDSPDTGTPNNGKSADVVMK